MVQPLALATWQGMPQSCPDDAHLLRALEAAGVPARCVPWDADEDWGAFSGVLLRTTWDYYLRPEEFLAWIDGLEEEGIRLWNPPEVARWNSDKRYLAELSERGLPVVPTRFLEGGALSSLARLLDEEHWDDVVVKPSVSAGAHATFRTTRAQAPQAQKGFEELLSRGGVLVQPYVHEVAGQGEWSLVFVEGTFSHALLKRPQAGDFRVQEKHGGSLGAATPPPGVVEQAARFAAAAPRAPLLYARVDGVVRDGAFLLMELEALEPELFFRTAPGSAERFVAALRKRL